jgi:hypothetical protein
VARFAGLFPTQQIVALVETVGPERAESLAFRFRNEELLLAHASERPWLGWGAYARNRVFSASGDDVAVTDGLWIILLGQQGFAGMASTLALLLVPVIVAWRRIGGLPSPAQRGIVALVSVLVALCAVDLLPNSSIPPYTPALSGALVGLMTVPPRGPSGPAAGGGGRRGVFPTPLAGSRPA